MVSIDEISHISWFDFEVYKATNNKVETKGHVVNVTKMVATYTTEVAENKFYAV